MILMEEDRPPQNALFLEEVKGRNLLYIFGNDVVRKENDIAIPVYFKGYKGQILKKGKKYKVKE